MVSVSVLLTLRVRFFLTRSVRSTLKLTENMTLLIERDRLIGRCSNFGWKKNACALTFGFAQPQTGTQAWTPNTVGSGF